MNKDIESELQSPNVNLDAEDSDTFSDIIKDKPYPKIQILLSYTLLGGMLGRLLVWVGIGIVSPEVLRSIDLLSIAIGGGGLIGLIPALVTALIIIKLRIYRSNIFDCLKILAIGVATPVFFVLAIMLFNKSFATDIDYSVKQGFAVLLMGIIGGLSSLIIGWFAIPRRTTKS